MSNVYWSPLCMLVCIKSNNDDKCARELRKLVSIRALCQVLSLHRVWLCVLSLTMPINLEENLESMCL